VVSVAGAVAIPTVSRNTPGTNLTGRRSPGTTSSGPDGMVRPFRVVQQDAETEQESVGGDPDADLAPTRR
jgi:hypothetical protein